MNILEQVKSINEAFAATKPDTRAIELHFADMAKVLVEELPYYERLTLIDKALAIHAVYVLLRTTSNLEQLRAISIVESVENRYKDAE